MGRVVPAGAIPAAGSADRAIGVAGLAALGTGGFSEVTSVSCGPARNCVAGGYYTEGSADGTLHGFVAVERNGRWGTAIQVPGLGS